MSSLHDKDMAAYRAAMFKLYRNVPVFSNFVQQLGIPIFDENENEDAVRAYVSWNKNNKMVEFHLNAFYILTIKPEELAAVISHETYHVMLDHLEEIFQTKKYPVKAALVEAHECVINDGLLDNIGYHLPENVVYGTEKYNQDMSNFTTKEAYDFIVDKMKDNENNDQDDDKVCGGFEIDPDDVKDFNDFINGVLQDVIDNMADDDLKNVPDNLKDSILDYCKDSNTSKSNNFGDENVILSQNINMNWYNLISKINPKIKSAGKLQIMDSWKSPNNRLIATYPSVILPQTVYKDNKHLQGKSLPVLIIALDLSSSIPRDLVNDLVSLVNSVPNEYIIPYPITWSDSYLEWDSNKKKIVREGGTNIDCVAEYAKKIKEENNVDPYVVVITDGQFNFYFPSLDKNEIKEKWYWLGIDGNYDIASIKRSVVSTGYGINDHIFSLKDFSK